MILSKKESLTVACSRSHPALPGSGLQIKILAAIRWIAAAVHRVNDIIWWLMKYHSFPLLIVLRNSCHVSLILLSVQKYAICGRLQHICCLNMLATNRAEFKCNQLNPAFQKSKYGIVIIMQPRFKLYKNFCRTSCTWWCGGPIYHFFRRQRSKYYCWKRWSEIILFYNPKS